MLDDESISDPASQYASGRGIALVGLNAEDWSVRWYRHIKALPDNRPDPADSALESQHSKDFVSRFIQTSPDGRYVSLALAPVISSSSPRRYIPQRGHSSSDQKWSQTVAVFSADTGELVRRVDTDQNLLGHALTNSALIVETSPTYYPDGGTVTPYPLNDPESAPSPWPATGWLVGTTEDDILLSPRKGTWYCRARLPHSDAEYRRCHHRPEPAHGGSRLARRPGRMGGALRRHEQRHGHSKHPRLVPDPPRPGEPRLGRPRRHHRAIGDGLPDPYRQDSDTQLLDLGADGETAHRTSHPRPLAAPHRRGRPGDRAEQRTARDLLRLHGRRQTRQCHRPHHTHHGGFLTRPERPCSRGRPGLATLLPILPTGEGAAPSPVTYHVVSGRRRPPASTATSPHFVDSVDMTVDLTSTMSIWMSSMSICPRSSTLSAAVAETPRPLR